MRRIKSDDVSDELAEGGGELHVRGGEVRHEAFSVDSVKVFERIGLLPKGCDIVGADLGGTVVDFVENVRFLLFFSSCDWLCGRVG